MRMFWTAFFLGSLLLIGLDVTERRHSAEPVASSPVATDPVGFPTPNL